MTQDPTESTTPSHSIDPAVADAIGLWATPERSLSFDLRDFDETHPGPFEWDVKRLAASLVV